MGLKSALSSGCSERCRMRQRKMAAMQRASSRRVQASAIRSSIVGRAGSTAPHHDGAANSAPARTTAKAPATLISRLLTRLRHLLPTLRERRCRRPGKAHFQLAGWPLPGGSRTLWITAKGFRASRHAHPPLQGFSCRKVLVAKEALPVLLGPACVFVLLPVLRRLLLPLRRRLAA